MLNVNVGQHLTIVCLVKGIFYVCPPIPRYSATWDVQKVLDFLEASGKPDTISLKALTLRMVFLMAITHPSRSADLSQLSIDHMKTYSKGVAFAPPPTMPIASHITMRLVTNQAKHC